MCYAACCMRNLACAPVSCSSDRLRCVLLDRTRSSGAAQRSGRVARWSPRAQPAAFPVDLNIRMTRITVINARLEREHTCDNPSTRGRCAHGVCYVEPSTLISGRNLTHHFHSHSSRQAPASTLQSLQTRAPGTGPDPTRPHDADSTLRSQRRHSLRHRSRSHPPMRRRGDHLRSQHWSGFA